MGAVRADAAGRPPTPASSSWPTPSWPGVAEAEAPTASATSASAVRRWPRPRVFEGVHYAALGHLHRVQQPVPGRVVYSGSPLAYSFSEEGQTKSVTIVDLAADGVTTLELIPCPVARPLARLSGPLAVCSPSRSGRPTSSTGCRSP